MDSNFESRSPENADKETPFPKSSTDKANRKYRRHSSVSGSASPTSDGSPKRRRSPSPDLSKENPSRKHDAYLKRKNGGRELDMESGRGRFDKDSDSHRQSSRDYHRDGEHNRYHKRDGDKDRSYHKRDDDKNRSYHRSSGYGRESRSDSRSDRTRQVSERDRSGDYRQSTDKYSQKKSYDVEHRGMDKDREVRRKHRDEDSTTERGTSGKRHTDSNTNDSKHGDWDRHNKDGGRNDRRGYGKNLADHKSENTGYDEDGTRRHSNAGKESTDSYMEESQRKKVDPTEKRKHDDRESGRHEERFSRETIGKLDNDSSPRTFKSLHTDKDKNNGKDGQFFSKFTVAANERPPSSSKLHQETVDKVVKEPAKSCSNEAAASHDFNAAKDAALKAAELVNRNLVGGGYMSTDQKKKLLWGSKKNTAVEEPGHRWDVPLFTDRERQEKFNKLMGVKGDPKPVPIPDNKDGSGVVQSEKQEQLQLDLEKQYTAGLRRRDGRTVGLGL